MCIDRARQSIGTVQLAKDEIKRYANVPVVDRFRVKLYRRLILKVLNLDNGFYCFPPNPSGLVKFAIHHAGYLNPVQSPFSPHPSHEGVEAVSVPRTKLTAGGEDGAIPREMVRALRMGLQEFYPELAKKPFAGTRMCWSVAPSYLPAGRSCHRYCDTASGDWLIDYHPDCDNLFLATGGSGQLAPSHL